MPGVVRSQEEVPASEASSQDAFVIEESLGYLVNRLARSFERALALRLADHGVTVAQWAVLLVLWADDGPTQRTLSRRVAIDEATMARTLDRMERDGLVRRVRNRQDRRRTNIRLTDRGRALRDPLVPLAEQVNALATTTFTDEDRGRAHDLIRRMIASLETPPPRDEDEESP